jgi:biopolymer transport protein ExbD
MRFRRPNEEDIRLGIAPLIDIVFLLLIFFMVTSHFDVASGVRIRLPQSSRRILDQVEDKITLVLDRSGKVYFEGREMDQETLREDLEDIVGRQGIVRLVLQADKDVRHGQVVEIMDLAKAAGVHSIIIAAQWKSQKLL